MLGTVCFERGMSMTYNVLKQATVKSYLTQIAKQCVKQCRNLFNLIFENVFLKCCNPDLQNNQNESL